MTFEELHLLPQILHSLKAKGYTTPTPIQEKSIPHILAGKDIFGSAQTGTGKTAAFALPILQMLFDSKASQRKGIKTLILAPTRELAQQISDSFRDYGKGLHIKHTVIYGGVSQRPQTEALRTGVDIVIATPGRLLDLINQGYVKLNTVEFFVLDEVDRMLDMGFINDIKKIIRDLPAKKQTLFFSATMPNEIKKLSDSLLQHPVSVQINPGSSAAISVKQFVYFVDKASKKDLLKNFLQQEIKPHVLVFTRTKRGADKLVKSLTADGIRAEAIHGDKSQGSRQRALENFKKRTVSMLVATDVASRGLDITDISHVINFDLPEDAETYVHRIGRTGRAGATGIAISFCSPDERGLLKDIQKLAKNNIDVISTPTLPKIQPRTDFKYEHKHAPRHGSRHETRSEPGREPRHHQTVKGPGQYSSPNRPVSAEGERKFVPGKKRWNNNNWKKKRSNRNSSHSSHTSHSSPPSQS
jgi:ATP-dependent RNA helicase RhlE